MTSSYEYYSISDDKIVFTLNDIFDAESLSPPTFSPKKKVALFREE
jgi:hypothetical protein